MTSRSSPARDTRPSVSWKMDDDERAFFEHVRDALRKEMPGIKLTDTAVLRFCVHKEAMARGCDTGAPTTGVERMGAQATTPSPAKKGRAEKLVKQRPAA